MTDAHDHSDPNHSHVQTVTRTNERKILISFFLILTFMIVEAVGGVISGSLALLADAGHMLTDAIALGLAYLAFRLGRRAADSKRTFGYMRFEVIAGLINALTLFGIVIWIVIEAYERIQQPYVILAGPMMLVAITGLLVNIFVLWFLTRSDTDHVNVKGAVLHVMGDLLGSVGAIAASVIIWYTGWTPIDPILSVLVSLLILRSAWALLKNALHILLEGAPANADADAIKQHLEREVPGVAKISHVHVWSITSGRVLATMQLHPKSDADVPDTARAVEHVLKDKFGIEHPTVGITWNEVEACSLREPSAISADHVGHAH